MFRHVVSLWVQAGAAVLVQSCVSPLLTPISPQHTHPIHLHGEGGEGGGPGKDFWFKGGEWERGERLTRVVLGELVLVVVRRPGFLGGKRWPNKPLEAAPLGWLPRLSSALQDMTSHSQTCRPSCVHKNSSKRRDHF